MSLKPEPTARTLSISSMNKMPPRATFRSPLAAWISFERAAGVMLMITLLYDPNAQSQLRSDLVGVLRCGW
jgi:hypothetical protein